MGPSCPRVAYGMVIADHAVLGVNTFALTSLTKVIVRALHTLVAGSKDLTTTAITYYSRVQWPCWLLSRRQLRLLPGLRALFLVTAIILFRMVLLLFSGGFWSLSWVLASTCRSSAIARTMTPWPPPATPISTKWPSVECTWMAPWSTPATLLQWFSVTYVYTTKSYIRKTTAFPSI